MTSPVLTEDESSRISWAAWGLDIKREDLLRSVQQIKSSLVGDGSLYRQVKARIDQGIDEHGTAVRAVLTMVKGAVGGAMVGFSGPLAAGLVAMLAEIGIAVAATTLAPVIFVIGAVLLIGAITELPNLLASLKKIDWSRELES